MRVSQAHTTKPKSDLGLVNNKELLELLFPNKESRPSLRWLEEQRYSKLIPFCRIGRLVFFDPVKVRAALDSQATAKYGGDD